VEIALQQYAVLTLWIGQDYGILAQSIYRDAGAEAAVLKRQPSDAKAICQEIWIIPAWRLADSIELQLQCWEVDEITGLDVSLAISIS